MSEATANYSEMYKENGAYSDFSQTHWSDDRTDVNFIRIRQDDVEAIDPATHSFALGVALGGKAGFDVDFGEGVRSFKPFSQGVYLNNTLADTRYRQRGSHDLLFIDCPYTSIAAKYEMDSLDLARRLAPLHERIITDFGVRRHCVELWAMSKYHGLFASLAIDHGIAALAAKLALLAQPEPITTGFGNAPLQTPELNRLDAFVYANLDEAISAKTLAELVRRPESRFLADFKATTGETPYQYVLSRRIARAQELLAAGEMPLAEVAYACGFASQSHMTDVFREKLGITPGRYRKEVRG